VVWVKLACLQRRRVEQRLLLPRTAAMLYRRPTAGWFGDDARRFDSKHRLPHSRWRSRTVPQAVGGSPAVPSQPSWGAFHGASGRLVKLGLASAVGFCGSSAVLAAAGVVPADFLGSSVPPPPGSHKDLGLGASSGSSSSQTAQEGGSGGATQQQGGAVGRPRSWQDFGHEKRRVTDGLMLLNAAVFLMQWLSQDALTYWGAKASMSGAGGHQLQRGLIALNDDGTGRNWLIAYVLVRMQCA
jgi:hypothetical protein